jgi:hypothetical protein
VNNDKMKECFTCIFKVHVRSRHKINTLKFILSLRPMKYVSSNLNLFQILLGS